MPTKKKNSKPLTAQSRKFAENIVNGKNQTDAYTDAYPKSSREAARRNASRLMAKDDIFDYIEKRKLAIAQSSSVTTKQVLGATAQIAFASIEDALDDSGNLDFRKAKQNGAASLIKKISRSQTKYGENISVEFYSKADALDRLGDYLGMKQKERENSETLEKVVMAYSAWFEDNPEASPQERAVWVERFALGGNVDAEDLARKVGVEFVRIEEVQ